jgi:hypothetical protein
MHMFPKGEVAMSGQAGGRGYLVQGVISVLDALADGHDWVWVAVDPNVGLDKVDILWQYPTRRKVVQVKSSQNRISVSDLKEWATELEKSITADEYEIRLIGPVSDEVPKLGEHGKVKIAVPEALNLDALQWQAAHLLYRYMHSKNLPAPLPSILELMVEALVTRFSTFAAKGKQINRTDFDELLCKWIGDIAAKPPQLLPSNVPSKVQETLQEAIWQSRSRALQGLQATASEMIDRARPDVEDWSEVCEDMAEGFDLTLARLKKVNVQEGQYLSKAVLDLVHQAISLGHDGAKEVTYPEGPPEVSMKGREIAGQLYDVITLARDQSAKEIREAAGLGDDRTDAPATPP